MVDEGIENPNGVLFSPDQSLLYVSDYIGQLSWVFQIQPDGSLTHKQRYFYVHMPDAATRSVVGRHGGGRRRPRLHRDVARRAGVRSDWQVPRHHPGAAARRRCRTWSSAAPNFDEMYVTNGDKVFKRKTKVKGVLSWRPPIKPAPPRL